eukprot:PhM_4_TR10976/c0_g2_i1/m.32667/K01835/pgm; phosphoglucomutase
MPVSVVTTTPYTDQKPGTSGLRKPVKTFLKENYLHNFVQAVFDVLGADALKDSTLALGGDGRYYCAEAAQIIVKMAVANGVKKVVVGKDGCMSTPAVSAVIRNRQGLRPDKFLGGFILTASHNPGGPDADFGIKYNGENGGPANEAFTDAVYKRTLEIKEYKIDTSVADVDLAVVAAHSADGYVVEVIDSTVDYLACLAAVFDMEALKRLVQRPDFKILYDGLNGVGGPYARKVIIEALGAAPESVMNAVPLPDFGGCHPDPNLTYADVLVKKMGLTREGTKQEGIDASALPTFGAATDGDADRNMVLGSAFFVTPSDSLAIIAANAQAAIPFFKDGVKAIARSMPTSAAADRVAAALNLKCFEVPTGWKFFGNLMDSKERFNGTEYTPLICGEESFGTGSNHVREKDGLWAICAWLAILAHRNPDASKPLVTVEQIVREHWKTYGRNYYCRYDYEGVTSESANAMMAHLRELTDPAKRPNVTLRGKPLKLVDDFRYVDPVDNSVSEKQGLRFVFEDDSRFVFRLSGTGSSGATIRLYMECYEPDAAKHDLPTATAVAELVTLALEVSKLAEFTGRKEPTVIT